MKRSSFSVWLLVVFTLTVMTAISVLDRPLRTGAAPRGIVSFELAGRLDKTRAVLDSWTPRARIFAGISLGLDYLFMILYGLTLWWVIRLLALRFPKGSVFYAGGLLLSAIIWVAVGADALENYGLIRLLTGGLQASWAHFASLSAQLKFAIVGLGLLYALVAGLLLLFRRK